MHITLSEPHVIDLFETLEVELVGFHIDYELNQVLALGKNHCGMVFSGVIIDDLEGADLSVDNFCNVFQAYIESTYDAAS